MARSKLTLESVTVTVPNAMKKEVLIAIIVGLVLGLVITFGIYRAQSSINQRQEEVSEQANAGTDSTEHQLTIIQPEDGSIVDDDQLTISGVTSKNSLVTIASDDDQIVVQADELGNFSGQLELNSGINQLFVTAYSLDGREVNTPLKVVFSTADLGDADGQTNKGEGQ